MPEQTQTHSEAGRTAGQGSVVPVLSDRPWTLPVADLWGMPVWLASWCAFTAAALLFSLQIYFSQQVAGGSVTWGQALYWSFGDWYEWWLLSPLVFWGCRLFPLTRRTLWWALPALLVWAVVLALVHAVLCAVMAKIPGNPVAEVWTDYDWWGCLRYTILRRSAFNLVVVGILGCAWHALMHHQLALQRQQELARLGQMLAESRLAALRMQLNPHFLFNTLNTVSSLMLSDVRAANQVVSRLGGLLRAVLDSGEEQEVSLGREVELAMLYLEIEQARHRDRLKVALNIDPSLSSFMVPTLLLQPLVENSVRHAIAHRVSDGRIRIAAWLEGAELCVEVRDNGTGEPPRWPPAGGARAGGIGLENTRRRLAALHQDRAVLTVGVNDWNGISALVRLPARKGAASS